MESKGVASAGGHGNACEWHGVLKVRAARTAACSGNGSAYQCLPIAPLYPTTSSSTVACRRCSAGMNEPSSSPTAASSA